MTWIAVFTKNGENPNYQAFLHGAERVAAAKGARISRHVPHHPDNAEEQVALLRGVIGLDGALAMGVAQGGTSAVDATQDGDIEVIASRDSAFGLVAGLEVALDLEAGRPDAIIFAPADDQALQAPVAEVNAAGIPLIGFVNRMAGRFVSFVGADDEAMARAAATFLIQALGGRGQVVLIEGPETAPTNRDRARGFRAAIAAHPHIHLLGIAPGRYLHSGGRHAMAALLAAHAHIDGVICTNDSMALGALEVLAEAGRHALVVGNNGTMEAARAVGEGRLLATMDYDGFKMGCLATMAALRHLRGLPVPAEIMLPAQVIHRANHAAWLVPVERRPLPAWEDFVFA